MIQQTHRTVSCATAKSKLSDCAKPTKNKLKNTHLVILEGYFTDIRTTITNTYADMKILYTEPNQSALPLDEGRLWRSVCLLFIMHLL